MERAVICLDTNYLIGALVAGSPEVARIESWSRAGQTFMTSSIAWYEFLCGPVTDSQADAIRQLLTGGIAPFDPDHAREAARLFHASGRARRYRVDAMIAAAATLAGAHLATANAADFEPFTKLGLKLMR